MDFLQKLNYLMEQRHLNKSTLSKACNIPYTTIDGWYKKGYEGLKLTTLRKLAEFFGTSLDYWASEDDSPPYQRFRESPALSDVHRQILLQLEKMSEGELEAVLAFIRTLETIKQSAALGNGGCGQ